MLVSRLCDALAKNTDLPSKAVPQPPAGSGRRSKAADKKMNKQLETSAAEATCEALLEVDKEVQDRLRVLEECVRAQVEVQCEGGFARSSKELVENKVHILSNAAKHFFPPNKPFDQVSLMDARRAQRGPCRFHPSGQCRHGDHCRFSHDMLPAAGAVGADEAARDDVAEHINSTDLGPEGSHAPVCGIPADPVEEMFPDEADDQADAHGVDDNAEHIVINMTKSHFEAQMAHLDELTSSTFSAVTDRMQQAMESLEAKFEARIKRREQRKSLRVGAC